MIFEPLVDTYVSKYICGAVRRQQNALDCHHKSSIYCSFLGADCIWSARYDSGRERTDPTPKG